MALGDGKTTFLASIDSNKPAFITNVMQAEDDMVTNLMASQDPSQNLTQRQLKWDKIFVEFKKILEVAYDETLTEIKNNGKVLAGIEVNIPITASPGSPSTGATTSVGSIN